MQDLYRFIEIKTINEIVWIQSILNFGILLTYWLFYERMRKVWNENNFETFNVLNFFMKFKQTSYLKIFIAYGRYVNINGPHYSVRTNFKLD